MGRLDDRVILVTGSTGIAAAAAERAHAEGAAVFVISRTAAHAETLAKRLDGGWAAADLADETAADAAVAAAVERFGRIDGVFAVAGGSGRRYGDGPIHAMTAEGWDRTLELNLRSQALTARAVTRVMLAQPRVGPRARIARQHRAGLQRPCDAAGPGALRHARLRGREGGDHRARDDDGRGVRPRRHPGQRDRALPDRHADGRSAPPTIRRRPPSPDASSPWSMAS